jgi:hypothetical protein
MICNSIVSAFDALTSVNWLDVIKTVVALATAVVAVLALRNWQRQDRGKREAEFLDALIDAVHAYIVEMGRPIALVEMVRIGMRSQTSSWNDEDAAEATAKGAVAYIKKDGEREAKRLFEALNDVRPASIKLGTLGTKGQVFGFNGYSKCHTAIAKLVWQFDRIEALAGIVGSPTFNWDHPEVQHCLTSVLTVEPEDIRKRINENSAAVLNFARETYAGIYGTKRRI